MRIQPLVSRLLTACCCLVIYRHTAAAIDSWKLTKQPKHTYEHFISIQASEPLLAELECWGHFAASAYDKFESWPSCTACQQADIRDTQLLATWSTILPSFSRGFVGVHHPNRQIVIVFRGSSHIMDALSDAQTVQTTWPPTTNHTEEAGSKVHSGFLLAYTAAKPHIEAALLDVRSNVTLHNYSLHFIGHSLGAAQAALAFVDFSLAISSSPPQQSCYLVTFGAPRIGNLQFTRILQRLSLGPSTSHSYFQRYSRIVHEADLIVHLPLSAPFNSYTHGNGHELWIKDSETGEKCQTVVKCRDDTEDMQCSAGVGPLRWNIYDHWVYPGMRLGIPQF